MPIFRSGVRGEKGEVGIVRRLTGPECFKLV